MTKKTNSLDLKKLGTRIREKRESMNYTREYLAEKIGVSSKFISDVENGSKGVSLSTLYKLTLALKTSSDYLLFGSVLDFESLDKEAILSKISGPVDDFAIAIFNLLQELIGPQPEDRTEVSQRDNKDIK